MSEPGCALCELGDAVDVFAGWYSSAIPLCKSCRRMVVIRHDRARAGVPPPGRQYAHLRPGQFPLSARPWPYPDCETRVGPTTFQYYRSVRLYIDQEALSAPEMRKGYVDASLDFIASHRPAQRATNDAPAERPPAPTKKLSAKARQKAQEAQYRQQMLFSEFPPK